MAITRLIALLAIAALLPACTVPPRATGLSTPRPAQYLWPGDQGSDPHTLVILTASGGGQRAAALALGTLRYLDRIELAGGGTMLDEIDMMSGVSGGSVTAAWFALHGRDGFDRLEQAFIRSGGNGALLGRALEPGTLAALFGSDYTRLDVFADYLRDSLFGEATYADLVGRRPYLIVTAADMATASTFAFTQPWFDLICAELTALPLAEAVAASAAVPVLLAPLAIADRSPCAEQFPSGDADGDGVRLPAWARWIGEGLDFARHGSIERLRRARIAASYLNLDCRAGGDCTAVPAERQKRWLHLLDGTLVDYLGLTEPFRLISTQEVAPFLLPEIVSGRISRIVVIVVSARIDAVHDIDSSGEVPDLFAMLRATATSPMNAAALGLVGRLLSLVEQGAADFRDELQRYGRVVYKDEELRLIEVPELAPEVERIGLVVDFELIEDPACRRAFNEIPTSWTIGPRQIGALIHVAGPLLAANPDFGETVAAMGGSVPPTESIADSCRRLTD